MGFLVALVGAGLLWWVLEKGSWPTGHGPFDALPSGLGAKPAAVRFTAPSSGLVYDTYTWPTAQPTVTFNVAALTNSQGWLSFWNDSSSGARTAVASFVQPVVGAPALAVLQKDFGLA